MPSRSLGDGPIVEFRCIFCTAQDMILMFSLCTSTTTILYSDLFSSHVAAPKLLLLLRSIFAPAFSKEEDSSTGCRLVASAAVDGDIGDDGGSSNFTRFQVDLCKVKGSDVYPPAQ
ncbi:hypothetical protein L1987_01452 [Smallanthus sonchifolius]|uniref:Uncharacterized protein n=1 Tax=Smallanthus sonchifolius TaxID=185202 RepID=A0ACB9K550_9ASTR|nr:hypothetical protein L1987_01452 [Smallanthus sonchifolius]